MAFLAAAYLPYGRSPRALCPHTEEPASRAVDAIRQLGKRQQRRSMCHAEQPQERPSAAEDPPPSVRRSAGYMLRPRFVTSR